MDAKNKIKQIYEKNEIIVSDEYIDNAMKDKRRLKMYMEQYEKEKIESMNYILGKPYDNTTFTDFELEAMSKINLFDKKLIKVCKIIWDNRNNEEKLEQFLKQLNIELETRRREVV